MPILDLPREARGGSLAAAVRGVREHLSRAIERLQSASSTSPSPDYLITSQETVEALRAQLEATRRYETYSSGASWAAPTISYQGIPVIADPQCPSDRVYGLSTPEFVRRYVGRDQIPGSGSFPWSSRYGAQYLEYAETTPRAYYQTQAAEPVDEFAGVYG